MEGVSVVVVVAGAWLASDAVSFVTGAVTHSTVVVRSHNEIVPLCCQITRNLWGLSGYRCFRARIHKKLDRCGLLDVRYAPIATKFRTAAK